MSIHAKPTLAGPSHIGIENRDAFHDAAVEAIDAMNGDGGVLVLDLANTEYIDTAGLGTMAMVHRRATEVGLEIQLVNANDEVINSLALARLDELFNVAESSD